MLEQVESIIKEFSSKPTWGQKEIAAKLTSLGYSITNQLKDDGKLIAIRSSKKMKVETIKKYDILYLAIMGFPHYFLVHKIVEDTVYGIVFSSKSHINHSLHEIQHDRFFLGNYATNGYFGISVEEAKTAFVRVFESRKEADEIFTKVKTHFKDVFGFRK